MPELQVSFVAALTGKLKSSTISMFWYQSLLPLPFRLFPLHIYLSSILLSVLHDLLLFHSSTVLIARSAPQHCCAISLPLLASLLHVSTPNPFPLAYTNASHQRLTVWKCDSFHLLIPCMKYVLSRVDPFSTNGHVVQTSNQITNLPSKISKVTNLRTLSNAPTSNSPLLLPDPATITNIFLKSNNTELLAQSTHTFSQWTPDLVQTILKRLWNHGPKAIQFFKLLEDHPSYAHSAIHFDHAIDIAARMRDYKTMWALLCNMRSRKLGPSPKTFAIIIERYVSSGKADKAVKIFLSMHEHGCQQDLNSFNALLDVLCKSKRVEMAHRLFKVFRGRFKADVVSYNIIANGFCLKKQTPRALEVVKEMVERGVEPTLTTYNILLKGYLRAGQITEGWEFFLQMKKRKIEIDVVTYTTVIHGFGVTGEVEKSRKVFNEMIGAGVLPSLATYNALIQVLCKKDCVENAIVVFEDMLTKGYVPNATTYNVVIRGLCHAGKIDMAIEYMDKMKDDCEPTIQTFNVVIKYCCEDGKIEKALEMFDKMNGGTCLPNLDTYNILIGSMFVRKKSDDLLVAGKLLIEMVDRGFMPRRLTFNRVLNGLMLTGNQGFAQEILRLQSTCGGLPSHFRL